MDLAGSVYALLSRGSFESSVQMDKLVSMK